MDNETLNFQTLIADKLVEMVVGFQNKVALQLPKETFCTHLFHSVGKVGDLEELCSKWLQQS